MRLGVWQRLGVVFSVVFFLYHMNYLSLKNGDQIQLLYRLAYLREGSCMEYAERAYRQSILLPIPNGGPSWEQIRDNRMKECQDIFRIDPSGDEFQELKVDIYKFTGWIFETSAIIFCFWVLIYMILGVVRWVLRGRRT